MQLEARVCRHCSYKFAEDGSDVSHNTHHSISIETEKYIEPEEGLELIQSYKGVEIYKSVELYWVNGNLTASLDNAKALAQVVAKKIKS